MAAPNQLDMTPSLRVLGSRECVVTLASITLLLGSCTADRSATPVGPVGSYYLAAVGGRPPASYAQEGHFCEIPAFAELRFAERRWYSADSIPLTDRCAIFADSSYWQAVRRDSGVFRVIGDTITLSAWSSEETAHGVTALGRWSGDSILLWGSDAEPGDWLYVRVR